MRRRTRTEFLRQTKKAVALRGRASRRRRGTALVAALWLFPLSLLSMVIAYDYSTAIAVHREAVLTAQAMANAGATAVTSSTTTADAVINPTLATARAGDLYVEALQVGMLRQSSVLPGTRPRVTPTQTSVAVEIPVSTEMRVASLFLSMFSPGSPPVVVSSVGKAQTNLCVPQNVSTVPECAYPTVDLLN